MFLAIDCGNTNTVFALYKNGVEGGHVTWLCRTDSARTADEYASWLMPLFSDAGFGFADISETLISSVVPDANFNLKTLCLNYFNTEPRFVGTRDVHPGIEIDMPKPEEVGADRLVNAVAVKKRYTLPCIVVDFGTATTFDVVNQAGAYCGGVIAPGINLSLDALHRAAAKLPKVDIKKPRSIIGKDTVGAMQSGLYWGYVSLIEGIIARISDELGQKPTIVATGGLAPVFANGTTVIDHVDSDLTLDGLRLIQAGNSDADIVQSAA